MHCKWWEEWNIGFGRYQTWTPNSQLPAFQPKANHLTSLMRFLTCKKKLQYLFLGSGGT